jgi:hypothetical protein
MEAPNFRAEFAISSPSGLQFVACKKRGPPCQRHRSCLPASRSRSPSTTYCAAPFVCCRRHQSKETTWTSWAKLRLAQLDGSAASAIGGRSLCDSECSTPFVSASSNPMWDHHRAACFYSVPASPTRAGSGGCIDFDFLSCFPSPSAAAMSSTDELFCNGQIRPVRLAVALLQSQPPAPRCSSPSSMRLRPEGQPP